MDDKQQMIEKLTGIRSSRRSYYTQLVQVIDEMNIKNKQLEILSKLSKVHIYNSWEETSIYIAMLLSQVIYFDMFILTIIEDSSLTHYISQQAVEEWECKTFQEEKLPQIDDTSFTDHFMQALTLKGTDPQITIQLKNHMNTCLGFLTLLNRKGIPYSTSDISFFQRMADYVSVSIENILLFKDLNKKLNLEAQLIQSAKLAATGEMAAGVAHELNSPLTVILGNVQLLMRKYSEEPTKQMLQDIFQCGLRSKKIIENLLTFARQDECQYEILSLNELAQTSLELIGYQLNASGITVDTSLHVTPLYFKGSRYQIEQVIINLLLNARDALQDKKQGKIVILTGTMQIDGRDYVYLSVHDNGTGIKKEYLSKIFQPFFTTKEKYKGTGLGLSVSHGIAESHGGQLMVESEEDSYSTFTLALPACHEEGGINSNV